VSPAGSSKRSSLVVVAAVVAGLAAAGLLGFQLFRGMTGRVVHESARKPNVLLVTLDTCRRDHLSVYGYGRETTPALAALAKDAYVFDAAFTVASNSAPSHATILTGLYPLQHGLVDNGLALPSEIPSLAKLLTVAGYDTAGFAGYFALGPESGLDKGFRTFRLDKVDDHAHDTRALDTEMKGFTAAIDWIRAWHEKGPGPGRDAGHDRADPFFVWLHAEQMHEADPPKPYDTLFVDVPRRHDVRGFAKGTFNIRCFDDLLKAYLDGDLSPELQEQVLALYDGEVRLVDDTLAKLFGYLREAGLYDDTVIVIVADHGELFFEKPGGAFGLVEPGHTATYFDQVLHVPLIVKPQRAAGLPGGVRLPQMVSTVDIVPTVLELLHHDALTWLAGRSRVPLMRDPAARIEERIFFEETPYEESWGGLRTPEWKLIEKRAGDFSLGFLIDLANDPREERNAFQTAPEPFRTMTEELKTWRAGQKKIDPSSYADMSETMREELRRAGYIRDRKP